MLSVAYTCLCLVVAWLAFCGAAAPSQPPAASFPVTIAKTAGRLAVVLPFTEGDAAKLLQRLRSWEAEGEPCLAVRQAGAASTVSFVFWYARDFSQSTSKSLEHFVPAATQARARGVWTHLPASHGNQARKPARTDGVGGVWRGKNEACHWWLLVAVFRLLAHAGVASLARCGPGRFAAPGQRLRRSAPRSAAPLPLLPARSPAPAFAYHRHHSVSLQALRFMHHCFDTVQFLSANLSDAEARPAAWRALWRTCWRNLPTTSDTTAARLDALPSRTATLRAHRSCGIN